MTLYNYKLVFQRLMRLQLEIVAHHSLIKRFFIEDIMKFRRLCCCGCGELANFGNKWLFNHYLRRKKLTDEHKAKISASGKGRQFTEDARKKISIANKGKKRTPEQCIENSLRQKRKSVAWMGYANYEVYKDQLTPVEDCRKDLENPLRMQVRCYKCREYFTPTRSAVQTRIQSIRGNQIGECNLYCSNSCRNACFVFGKPWNWIPREPGENERPLQAQWRKLVLEAAEYQCEICGYTNDENIGLVAHHIDPVKCNPIESADVDNGLCLCTVCDKKVHKLEGCSTGFLAKL